MAAQGGVSPHLLKLAKFLVYVCRHGATDWGLRVDPDGWLDIDDVLALRPSRKLERGHVAQIVDRACDGRLELAGNRIRAVQGHSLAIRDDSLRRVTPDDDVPRWLIHGTDDASWLKIKDEGIKPMTRQHVHLAQTVAVVHDYSTVHIYVDKDEVLRSGREMLISRSGVVLCRAVIPPSAFRSAWHVQQHRELLDTPDTDWVVAEEVETTTRWKQIRLGEWTHEYSVWRYSSAAEKRLFPIAKPPDSSADMPKRQFLKELSAWRRGLHAFQEWLEKVELVRQARNPQLQAAPASPYSRRTSYPPSKRRRTEWSETVEMAAEWPEWATAEKETQAEDFWQRSDSAWQDSGWQSSAWQSSGWQSYDTASRARSSWE